MIEETSRNTIKHMAYNMSEEDFGNKEKSEYTENIEGMEDFKDISIEEKFDRLEELLDKIEDDETGLELSFTLYEEGVGLIKSIEADIDKVEKRIKILEEGEEL